MAESRETSTLKSYDKLPLTAKYFTGDSYLGSTLHSILYGLHTVLVKKKIFFLPRFRLIFEHKDQCLHGSWHTVPSTKYVFAE